MTFDPSETINSWHLMVLRHAEARRQREPWNASALLAEECVALGLLTPSALPSFEAGRADATVYLLTDAGRAALREARGGAVGDLPAPATGPATRR